MHRHGQGIRRRGIESSTWSSAQPAGPHDFWRGMAIVAAAAVNEFAAVQRNKMACLDTFVLIGEHLVPNAMKRKVSKIRQVT